MTVSLGWLAGLLGALFGAIMWAMRERSRANRAERMRDTAKSVADARRRTQEHLDKQLDVIEQKAGDDGFDAIRNRYSSKHNPD